MMATYKPLCTAEGEEVEDCRAFISTDERYYLEVLNECQNQTECSVKATQIIFSTCDSNIVWRNFIEIYFDCVTNGELK